MDDQIPIGESQLFLDDTRIEERVNVKREWHRFEKHPDNPLISASGREERIYGFGSVRVESDPSLDTSDPVFRMWYFAGGQRDQSEEGDEIDKTKRSWIAYARSRDGIKWEKPEVGLGNAVHYGGHFRRIDLSGVCRDPQDGDYHFISSAEQVKKKEKLYVVADSSDGIHWQDRGVFVPPAPAYPDRACFVRDPIGGGYRLYCRTRYNPQALIEKGGAAYFGRAVALLRSPDLAEWSEPTLVIHADENDPPGTEIYGGGFFPYAGHWIGLVQIHRSLVDHAYIDIGLAHSRDGIDWKREAATVLPLGDVGEWDRFNQSTAIAPVKVGDELWLYYSGRTYRHGEYKKSGLSDSGPTHSRIGLARIRLDGWCSLQSSFDGGHVLTRPFVPTSEVSGLSLNAKADWGCVNVQLQNAEGGVLAESEPCVGDGVRIPVSWRGTENPFLPEGATDQGCRLRFELKNACLYSWALTG